MRAIEKILQLLAIGSLILFITYAVYGFEYPTQLFLPFGEGLAILAVFILALNVTRIQVAQSKNTYTLLPILTTLLLITIIGMILYESRLLDDLSIVFFLIGGLGMVLMPISPLLLSHLTVTQLLVFPVMYTFFFTLRKMRETSSTVSFFSKANLLHFVIPLVAIIISIPLFLSVRHIQNSFESASYELDRKSFELGVDIQHEIEKYNYSGNNSYPPNLDSLVPDYLHTIPTSPISNRPYTYEVSSDLQSYKLCIPMSNGERCRKEHYTDL